MSKSKAPSTGRNSGIKTHTVHNDNSRFDGKIKLRQDAIRDLEKVNVLDCFGGENRIWNSIPHDRYYGIEKIEGKGTNLCADNVRVLESIDLSGFNVIDMDSYGTPIDQMLAMFQNETLQKGTIVFYTCITGPISGPNRQIVEMFNMEKMMGKARTLVNRHIKDIFYGFLYKMGVTKIVEFESGDHNFEKKYGYFII